MKSHKDYLTQGYVKHVFLLISGENSMWEWILVVDEFKSLVQLHCFGDEEHLESIKETFDDPLVINVATSVNFSPKVMLDFQN